MLSDFFSLLQFLGTPSAIVSQSYLYISTIVNGVAVTFAYNLCAGLLRAVGDSLAALYFLIIAAILNILLDLYFITQLHLGVQSAGIATIIAQSFFCTSLFLLYSQKSAFPPAKSQRFCLGSKALSRLNQSGIDHGAHVFYCLYRNSYLTISYQ